MSSAGTFIGAQRRTIIIVAVIVGIPLLALAWSLGSPLFLNKTVDEEFPFSVGAVVPEGMTRAQVDQTMATMAMMDDAVSEAMPEKSLTPVEMAEAMLLVLREMTPEAVEEMEGAMEEAVLEKIEAADLDKMRPLMMAALWTMVPDSMDSIGGIDGIAPEAMAAMIVAMADTLPSEMTAEMLERMQSEAADEMRRIVEQKPTAVTAGMFRDADGFHKGSGSATVYQLADSSYVLRLEDFQVTNGPDLRVILATHPDPQGRGDVHTGDYVELGKLKGNIGNQNYPLPEGLSPDGFGSVVIYCKPFQVVFSVAPLSDG